VCERNRTKSRTIKSKEGVHSIKSGLQEENKSQFPIQRGGNECPYAQVRRVIWDMVVVLSAHPTEYKLYAAPPTAKFAV
jgi:hypothetical protein